MQLEAPVATIEQNITTEKKDFKIKPNAKAFEILSSHLYKDPITAICRELGTNAADSHIAAGKKHVPFIVHLPNKWEPWFSVKDEGVGLSDDQVNNIYTTYFESDKTHSNDYTGCLGLGSKSPFAYTDSFMVIATYEGMKRSYNMFMDEGMPAFTKMGEEPTEEPNGVEVKFAVKQADFDTFRIRAIQIYRWFETQPLIPGVTAEELQRPTCVLDSGDWAISRTPGHITFWMGNIAYIMPKTDVPQDFFNSLHKAEQELIDHIGPMIRLNIGDVDVAANRESLRFTQKTQKVIRERMGIILRGVQDEVRRQIQEAPTFWQARLKAVEIGSSSWLSWLMRNEADVDWNGKPVTTRIKLLENHNGESKLKMRAIRYTTEHQRRCRKRKLVTAEVGTVDDVQQHEKAYIEVRPNLVLYINDMQGSKGKDLDRIKYNCDRLLGYGQREGMIVISESKDYPLQQIIDEEDLSTVIRKVSDLPEAPRLIRAARSKPASILRFNSGTTCSHSWREATIDMEQGGVYVAVNNYMWYDDIRNAPHFTKPHWLSDLFDNASSYIGFGSEEIVGVRKRPLEKFKKHRNWQTLGDFIREKIKHDEKIKLAYVGHQLWESIGLYQKAEWALCEVEQLKKKSPFRQLVEQLKALSQYSTEKIQGYTYLCNRLNVPLPSVRESAQKLDALCDQVKERYPLIQHVEIYKSISSLKPPEVRKQVVEYVAYQDKMLRKMPISKAPATIA